MMRSPDPYPARSRYADPDVARTYDAQREGLIRRLELGCVSRALEALAPEGSILDIPCGTGRLTALLATKFEQVHGIDLSEPMLEQARMRLAGQPHVQLSLGDAAALPFPVDSFDYCLSMRFFGHTPPEVRRQIFRELARVTSRRMLLTLYVRDPVIQRRKQLQSVLGHRIAGPWYPYGSIEEGILDLELAGLKVVAIHSVLPWLLEARVYVAERLR